MSGRLQHTGFLALPTEIREIIYEHCCNWKDGTIKEALFIDTPQPDQSWKRCMRVGEATDRSASVLSLLQVNSCLREELTQYLLGSRLVSIGLPRSPGLGPGQVVNHFRHWLPRIRQLELRNVDLGSGGRDLGSRRVVELLGMCASPAGSLQTLDIEFTLTLWPWFLARQPFLAEVGSIALIKRIVELKGMQRVTLRLSDQYDVLKSRHTDPVWKARGDGHIETFDLQRRVIAARDNCAWSDTMVKDLLELS